MNLIFPAPTQFDVDITNMASVGSVGWQTGAERNQSIITQNVHKMQLAAFTLR